jgi:pilus assembly protein CpaE
MFLQLTASIVDADPQNREELAQVLSGYGVSVGETYADVASLEASLKRGDKPQVVVVNLDPAASETLNAFKHLPRSFPQVAFFAMSQVLDPQLLMKSMSVGVREFIPLPMTEEVLSEALGRVSDAHGGAQHARIINVVPTTGGCGSTTIACNVAASIAAEGKSVCLVDLDLVRGDVAGAFDARPSYTVSDVMSQSNRIDQKVVENALFDYDNSGLKLLSRPDMIEETQRVTQQGVQKLLGLLGRMFDYVVIDSVMSVDPVYATVISASDYTLLTMQLNVPSAKNAERFVGALRRMGVEASKIRVIVNRYVKKGADISPAEVERALGLSIDYTIPNDFKTAISAINYGEPAVLRNRKAEMSIALRQIGSGLIRKQVEEQPLRAAA